MHCLFFKLISNRRNRDEKKCTIEADQCCIKILIIRFVVSTIKVGVRVFRDFRTQHRLYQQQRKKQEHSKTPIEGILAIDLIIVVVAPSTHGMLWIVNQFVIRCLRCWWAVKKIPSKREIVRWLQRLRLTIESNTAKLIFWLSMLAQIRHLISCNIIFYSFADERLYHFCFLSSFSCLVSCGMKSVLAFECSTSRFHVTCK